MFRTSVRSGLTPLEALISIAVILIAVLVFLSLMTSTFLGPRSVPAQLKDSTQVRDVLQALVIHAQNNQDRFPLPSVVDAGNATIVGGGTAKDHTANIFSMLINNGSVSQNYLIAINEANPRIAAFEGYEFDEPSTAARPAEALWDPAFSADFVNGEGNISYAHLLPGGTRRPRWANTFDGTQPVIGNRGPRISGVTYSGQRATPDFDKQSNTLLIHGSRTKWEGNVGFADNHVSFEKRLAPDKAARFADADGTQRPDLLHYDEPSDPTDLNAFLGIFTTAGDATEDFTAIWD